MRKLIKTGLAVLAVSVSVAMPVSVVAGPLEDAKAAGMGGDHATALRLIRPLAE